jgi:hypothetical protein
LQQALTTEYAEARLCPILTLPQSSAPIIGPKEQ